MISSVRSAYASLLMWIVLFLERGNAAEFSDSVDENDLNSI